MTNRLKVKPLIRILMSLDDNCVITLGGYDILGSSSPREKWAYTLPGYHEPFIETVRPSLERGPTILGKIQYLDLHGGDDMYRFVEKQRIDILKQNFLMQAKP